MPTDRDCLVSQVWKPQVVELRLHGGHTVPVFISPSLVDPALPHLSTGRVAVVAIVVTRRNPLYKVFIPPRIALYILYVLNLWKLAARSGLQTFRP